MPIINVRDNENISWKKSGKNKERKQGKTKKERNRKGEAREARIKW